MMDIKYDKTKYGIPYMGSKKKIAKKIVDYIVENKKERYMTEKLFGSSNVVSEFFSERVHYFDNEGCDLDDMYSALNKLEYKATDERPGIEHIERNKDYVLVEISSTAKKSVTKYEKGVEKEIEFLKLVKTKVYIFEEFIACIGDAEAIKNFRTVLSEILLTDIIVLEISEMNMLNLLDKFSTIECVELDKVRHNNIKKIKVTGRAGDIGEFEINYDGYDICSILGKIKTSTDERKIKIDRTSKIKFYKPIYISHIIDGYKMLMGKFGE